MYRLSASILAVISFLVAGCYAQHAQSMVVGASRRQL